MSEIPKFQGTHPLCQKDKRRVVCKCQSRDKWNGKGRTVDLAGTSESTFSTFQIHSTSLNKSGSNFFRL